MAKRTLQEETQHALGSRLVASVAQKLGVSVEIARWDVHKTGASVPVFRVPTTHRALARSLGLCVA